MFHKANLNSDLKSEIERLWQTQQREASVLPSQNERITLASSSHKQYHNYFGNNSREDNKSHHRLRASNFNSLSQRSHQTHSNQEMDSSNNNNNISNSSDLNQRNGHHLHRSTTNPKMYQNPLFPYAAYPSTSTTTEATTTLPSRSSVFSKESSANPSSATPNNNITITTSRQPTKQRSSSVSTITNCSYSREHPEHHKLSMQNSQQDILNNHYHHHHHHEMQQQDRGSDDVVATVIRERLERDPNGFKEIELETLGSLEHDLPIELSFLIRQQAYCMARMNYLDRQVRELKEARQAYNANSSGNATQTISTPINQSQLHPNRTVLNNTTTTHTKNGNFIPSDDSGGEYSRATISDDDELSSLLDQIAKTVKPERNMNQIVNNNVSNNGNSQIRSNYGVISNQHQPYAILNPNQLHHHQAAVPVFFMGPSIAMAHPSSINSSVLPGVHFQSEPRYNQYCDDLYNFQNNSPSSVMHSRHDGIRTRQFDSSIAAIEQLVSQKERRQIKSQLKSADNWLKMRSSGLCNTNDNFSSNINNIRSVVTGSMNERNLPATSSSANNATENSVIEETRRSR